MALGDPVAFIDQNGIPMGADGTPVLPEHQPGGIPQELNYHGDQTEEGVRASLMNNLVNGLDSGGSQPEMAGIASGGEMTQQAIDNMYWQKLMADQGPQQPGEPAAQGIMDMIKTLPGWQNYAASGEPMGMAERGHMFGREMDAPSRSNPSAGDFGHIVSQLPMPNMQGAGGRGLGTGTGAAYLMNTGNVWFPNDETYFGSGRLDQPGMLWDPFTGTGVNQPMGHGMFNLTNAWSGGMNDGPPFISTFAHSRPGAAVT